MTEWHDSGRVKSHGRFVVKAGRSWAHGVWSFWYPSGRPQSVGRYHYGAPVGCVGQWDEAGELVTYAVAGDRLVPTSCEIARDSEAEGLAKTYATGTKREKPREQRAIAVLGFGSRISPSSLSFHPESVRPIDAQLGASFLVTVRHRWQWLSLGLGYGRFWTDDRHTSTSDVGILAGVARPFLSNRIAYEIEAEWGTRRYGVAPVLTNGQAADRIGLWGWYGGLRGGVELVVTRYLRVHVGVFVQQDLGQDIVREQLFVGPYRLPVQHEVEWELDNTVYGSLLELRIGIR